MSIDEISAPGCGGDPIPPPAIPPAALLFDAFQMWQMPMTLATGWWEEMMRAYLPPSPIELAAARHEIHHDPHAQLVVPEPIEAEGERALVA